MEPAVSLVMPVWKPRAEWLDEAVTTALDETEASIELLVVDDGCEEPVSGLLDDRTDDRLRVIRIDHGGPAAARDAGVAEARGDFIRFVDADDVVVPGSTGRLLRLATAGERAIAYGWTLLCRSDGSPDREVRSDLSGWIAEAAVLGGFQAYVVSMLLPREVVRAAGTWMEADFRVSGDWDFALRCLEQAPARPLGEVVTHYRRHDESRSRTADVDAGAVAGAAVIRRYFERNPAKRGSELERRAYARHHLNRARAHAWHGQRGSAVRQLAAAGRHDPKGAGVAAAGIAARRLADAIPAPVRDRGRLMMARRLENRARASERVAGAAIVMHAVGDRDGDRDFEIDPPVDVARLEWMVAHLAGSYRLVRAAELVDAAGARRPGEPLPIAFTFDDDLPSHATHALPVFERHGAPATAFLCRPGRPFWWWNLQRAIDDRLVEPADLPHTDPDAVAAALAREPRAIKRLAAAVEALDPPARDELALALAEAVPEPPPVLGDAELDRLEAAGWEIGAHTPGHYLATTLDEARLSDELERRPPRPGAELPQTLAYPHGKATRREAEAVESAGYAAAFTGRADAFGAESDPRLIGRLQPDLTSPGRFALALARSLAGCAAAPRSRSRWRAAGDPRASRPASARWPGRPPAPPASSWSTRSPRQKPGRSPAVPGPSTSSSSGSACPPPGTWRSVKLRPSSWP